MAGGERSNQMRKSKIVYNPLLTVAENARNNGVSVSAVRWYIKVNGIDRKRDNAIIIQRGIRELVKKHPDISVKDLSEKLKVSVNTIKKYLHRDVELSGSDSNKLSTFDTSKRKFLISSVSDSQDEVLNNILRLYVSNGFFDCDVTYSIGGFYKHIPQPIMKFDKYPQLDDVKPLAEFRKVEDGTLQSIVMDLPFIIRNGGGSTLSSCKIATRFNYFESTEEMYAVNDEMLELCSTKLAKKGVLIVKTMDVIFAGKQHWMANFLTSKATSMGLELVDMFILVSKSKLLRSDGCVQHHARKFHSYFLVFRKKRKNAHHSDIQPNS